MAELPADWFVPQIIAALDKEHSTKEEVERLRKYNAAAEENARRLARYDEAVAILRIGAVARPGSILYVGFMRRLNEFLAAEGKVAG